MYFFFYFKIKELTEKNLIIIQNNLKNNNIIIAWENIDSYGFPYRIVNELNNVKIKINSSEISIKNLNIIYQPWNIKHILIKISNKIDIIYNNNKIIIYPEILTSVVIDKNKEKRISMNFNEVFIKNDQYIHKINRPEIYFRESIKNNLQYSLKIKELFYYPDFINEHSIKNLLVNGKIINHKNINFNNYFEWLANEGGIDIDDFKFNISQISMKGNAFLGIDKNLDLQSSISIESNELDNLVLVLKNKNLITENFFEKSNIIIKAIELASKTSNTIPKFSVSIQNGYLSLMGIKLLNIPNLKMFKFN